jgi:putative FmdB family regulatory protein
MPIYEYECPDCGAITEVFSDQEKITCLNCGATDLKKIMSASNVRTNQKSAKQRRLNASSQSPPITIGVAIRKRATKETVH